jgi:hypothetical protein
LLTLEFVTPVLLAAAEETLGLVARQHLHALLVAQFQRLYFAPQGCASPVRNRLKRSGLRSTFKVSASVRIRMWSGCSLTLYSTLPAACATTMGAA